jgi:hypothetical protein
METSFHGRGCVDHANAWRFVHLRHRGRNLRAARVLSAMFAGRAGARGLCPIGFGAERRVNQGLDLANCGGQSAVAYSYGGHRCQQDSAKGAAKPLEMLGRLSGQTIRRRGRGVTHAGAMCP